MSPEKRSVYVWYTWLEGVNFLLRLSFLPSPLGITQTPPGTIRLQWACPHTWRCPRLEPCEPQVPQGMFSPRTNAAAMPVAIDEPLPSQAGLRLGRCRDSADRCAALPEEVPCSHRHRLPTTPLP